ncbi:MAG: sensor histidine kinase [Mycobacteriales bacterium]
MPAALSYRHEAFLYRGEDEFLAGTIPFVRDGVAAGEPVMVAVSAARIEAMRAELGDDAEGVSFVDMQVLGGNPARLIPAWQQFLDAGAATGRPARGIGEPVWAGRRPAELVESQLHEALLNMAVSPDVPLWLRCPYDADGLAPEHIDEALHSHPVIAEGDAVRGSTRYDGLSHVERIFGGPLEEPPEGTETLEFDGSDLPMIRRMVAGHATAMSLPAERTGELVLTMHEIAANSVRHGGGRGVLRIWREPSGLVCEVRDSGYIRDPLVGRTPPQPADESGRGLWLANQYCDLVQIRSTPLGTAVRVHTWL